MSAKYNLFRNPGESGKRGGKIHARPVNQNVIRMDTLIEEITNFSSFSSADVRGMLEMLRFIIDFHLKHGEMVDLESFGTFNISLKSIPATQAKEVTPSDVRFNRVVFRPSKELTNELRSMHLERAEGGSSLHIMGEEKRKKNILAHLEECDTIASSTVQCINHCSKHIALKDLKTLQKEQKIYRIGSRNNAQYVLG